MVGERVNHQGFLPGAKLASKAVVGAAVEWLAVIVGAVVGSVDVVGALVGAGVVDCGAFVVTDGDGVLV